MLIASARHSFTNPDVMLSDGHSFGRVDFETDDVVEHLSKESLQSELKNKRVLLLVHGYNNEHDEVSDAYEIIQQNVDQFLSAHYDLVVGYSWPGGDHALEWWSANRRANAVARRLRHLLKMINSVCDTLDVMSHSLGARVVLKALKESNSRICNFHFCTAGAVDNEVLEPDEEFHQALKACNKTFVFHSNKDGVLSVTYRAAQWDRALGHTGPEDRKFVDDETDQVHVANCKNVVSHHGGYKRSRHMYRYIDDAKSGSVQKFVTLGERKQ
ncbi:MAG: alpha/beta hydrolase [Pseudomonadota bacterium]